MEPLGNPGALIFYPECILDILCRLVVEFSLAPRSLGVPCLFHVETSMPLIPFLRTTLALSLTLPLLSGFVLGHPLPSALTPKAAIREALPWGGSVPSAEQAGGEVLVKFSPGWTLDQINTDLSQIGLSPLNEIPKIGVWVFKASTARHGPHLLNMLEQHPGIQWAETNGLVHASGISPDDVFYSSQQENLRLIRLPEAWPFTTGDDRPIGIIDTGLDMDHIDLEGKRWENPGEIPGNGIDDDGNGYIDDVFGWDFVNHDDWPQDDYSHGSHVAGIAAAASNNATGMTGVSWGARIMTIKALNSQGEGTFSDLAAAIIYAADNGARVLNLSLGSVNPSQTLADAVSYAASQGCLMVAAAGNGGSAVEYPAVYPQVIAIAASNNQDQPWTLSNYGPELDLSAPGVEIFSANRQGFYYISTGTSMAAAHVSGLASLIWSLQPTLSANQIRTILTASAEDIWSPGFDQRTGWGRIDAQKAVYSLVSPEITLTANPKMVSPQEASTITATITTPDMNIHPDDLGVRFTSDNGSLAPDLGQTTQGIVTTSFTSDGIGTASITADIGYGYTQSVEVYVRPFTLYLLNVSKGVQLSP
jgi:subtilisin family serine protease